MMAAVGMYGLKLLEALETDVGLQARIDAVSARVERTFALPAKRRLAYLGKRQRVTTGAPWSRKRNNEQS